MTALLALCFILKTKQYLVFPGKLQEQAFISRVTTRSNHLFSRDWFGKNLLEAELKRGDGHLVQTRFRGNGVSLKRPVGISEA